MRFGNYLAAAAAAALAVSPAMAAQWGIDVEQCMGHAAIARDLPDMSALWRAVHQRTAQEGLDADQDLYGGFVGNEDRRRLNHLRSMYAQELALDELARAVEDDEDLVPAMIPAGAGLLAVARR